MNTCHGLRARQTSRSNSSGVRLSGDAVAGHGVAGDVDRRAGRSRGRPAPCVVVTAYPGADPGHQLLGLERLHDVVVGAGLEPDHDVDGVALGREHHDRHARLGPDLLADVDAALAGQHQVEQHDVGLVGVERLHRLVTARHQVGVEALLAQHDRQHLRQRRVVVDDEHALRGSPRPGSRLQSCQSRRRYPEYGADARLLSSGTGRTCRGRSTACRGTTPGRRSAR